MPWKLFVEPTPGVSYDVERPSGEACKTEAAVIWKWATAAKIRFVIYDPSGQPWQTCTRHHGGSWRAKWEWVPEGGKVRRAVGPF